MIQFRLFNIQVTILPWFWLIMLYLGWVFTSTPGSSGVDGAQLLLMALVVLAGFLSLLIHEFGHALLIKKFGQPTEIVLHGMGGFATHPPGVFTPVQNFLVSAGGPAAQIAFGLVGLLLLQAEILPDTQIRAFVGFFTYLSLVWAVFNLLPIFPMDGGRMLAAFLPADKQPLVHLVGMALPIGIAGLALAFNYIAPFLFLFMALFAFQNFQLWKLSRKK